MLSCQLCRYRRINTILSLHPPLCRSYAAGAVSARVSNGSKAPPLASKAPPPTQFKKRGRPILDEIALTDPAKLADTVRRRLMRGDRTAAASLTREGSRTMNSVVSWNHIIKHHFDHSEIKRAFQSFNEMKKRNIKPDSHTFTIILNGLADHTHFGQSLSRALQTYNSLSLEKSPVSPNIYHTNAVLKVCARANDLDSMWSIVGKLPHKGPNAPDTLTYTTLLSAIYSIRDGPTDVEDGRRVWAGVLSRWTKGQLWIDEGLACAMCRVLLSGEREEDWKEVFTLCEQVFGIESLISKEPPKPATKDSIFVEGTTKQLPPNISDTLGIIGVTQTEDEIKPANIPKTEDTPTIATFKPLNKDTEAHYIPATTTHSSSTHPSPGTYTLSILLKACSMLDDEAMAFKYWEKLTNRPFFIKPDLDNYHERLRILRSSRLGTEALKVVEGMRVPPTEKTFYIAMSCCKRHGRSNAFGAAEGLLKLMVEKYRLQVDVKVWNMFLQAATKTGQPSYIKQALRRIDAALDIETELVRRRHRPLLVERALELVRSMVGGMAAMLEGDKAGVKWGHGERAVFERRMKELGGLVTRYGAGAKRRAYKIEMEGDDE